MNTLSLVDPAARQLAQSFAAFDPSRQPLDEYRANLASALAASAPPARVPFAERLIPGVFDIHQVRVLIYRPEEVVGKRVPAILFLHSSGFITGTPDQFRTANYDLAQKHGAIVVSVQYRLAPESPFPAALHDAYAALSWLFENAEELGVNPCSIIVLGESAGGGLAAMLALLARDRGAYALRGQVLIYPMLDPRTGTSESPAYNPTTGEFVWTDRHNRFAWSALRGEKGRSMQHGCLTSRPPAPRNWPRCRLRSWRSARLTCFSKKTWHMHCACRARESPLKLTCIPALFMASTWSRAKWHLNTTLIWHQP
jgi:acetyl esterase